MPAVQDYAAMSLSAYTGDDVHLWDTDTSDFLPFSTAASGFGFEVYQNGSEIVVSTRVANRLQNML